MLKQELERTQALKELERTVELELERTEVLKQELERTEAPMELEHTEALEQELEREREQVLVV